MGVEEIKCHPAIALRASQCIKDNIFDARMMHHSKGFTREIRLISRVALPSCIKMHRFASLFRFFSFFARI
jgi:hypothetical protein